jgi:hypothetical protein
MGPSRTAVNQGKIAPRITGNEAIRQRASLRPYVYNLVEFGIMGRGCQRRLNFDPLAASEN